MLNIYQSILYHPYICIDLFEKKINFIFYSVNELEKKYNFSYCN
jgi:hypothetical protein